MRKPVFWVAYLVVILRDYRVFRNKPAGMANPFVVWGPGSRYRKLFPEFLYGLLPMFAVATVLPFVVFSGILLISLPVAFVLILLSASSMVFFQNKAMRKVQSSMFADAVEITGDETAARNLMKKWTVFRWTLRGRKPLKGLTKWMAHYQYWINTPDPKP